MTRIFTPEKTISYAETRLFGANVTPEMVDRIELHNGRLPSQLRTSVVSEGGMPLQVAQNNGREPIYFSDGTLLIPQYSSFERGTRYENMIKRYLEASGRRITHQAHEVGGNRRVTYMTYDNNAYDFVVGLFVPAHKYADRRIFSCRTIENIDTIILGPTEAVAKQSCVIEKGKSEYIDSQIVEIDGKQALNIGYVYGSQGGLIISKMLREYAAIANERSQKNDIKVLMFGRVGGIRSGIERHDLVFPTGILDWVKIAESEYSGNKLFHIDNVLAPKDCPDLVLNVQSVLDETVEQLEMARSCGCTCVEMEERDIADAIDLAMRRYHPSINVRFGFVGHVSDKPLQGDTLDIELDSDKGEQAALARIIEWLRNDNQHSQSKTKSF